MTERGLVPTRVADEQLVEKRRAELVQAALELFLTQGFHKTTVREIAEAAGWQMGTLYLYVSSKTDILFLMMKWMNDELTRGIETDEEFASAEAHFRSAARRHLEKVHDLRRAVRFLYRESASLADPHQDAIKQAELVRRDYFARILQSGVDSGEFKQTDCRFLAYTFLMLAAMWPLKRWALTDTITLDDYIERQTEIILCQLRR